MTISYPDTEAFYDGIKSLVQRGLTFEAFDKSLKIVLTGGF